MAIARINIALGEYDRALEAIKRDRDKEGKRRLDRIISGEFLVGDTLNVFAEAPKYYIFSKLLLETGRIQEAKVGYDQLLQMPQVRGGNHAGKKRDRSSRLRPGMRFDSLRAATVRCAARARWSRTCWRSVTTSATRAAG